MASPPQESVASAPSSNPHESQALALAPVIADRPSEALWRKALDSVPSEDKALIDVQGLGRDKRSVLEGLIRVVHEKQKLCMGKQWTISRHGKVIPVRDLFGKTIACIKDFIAVGDTLVQYDPTHTAIPWATVRLVLQAATNDFETMQGMAVAVDYIVRLITRYALVESQYLTHDSAADEQLHDALTRVYTAILVYVLRAGHYYTHNATKRVISSAFRPARLQIDIYLEDVKTQEEEVEKLTWIMSMEYQRRTASQWKHDVAEMHSTLTDYTDLLKNVAEQVNSLDIKADALTTISCAPVTMDQILTWLDATYTASEYEDALYARLEGTCEWIFDRPVFKSWKATSDSADVFKVLWVTGAPGFGKTILCANVIERLYQEAVGPVLYFFCGFGDDEKRHPQAVLRSWTAQLASYSEESSSLAIQPFRERKAKVATELELWSLFRRLSLANQHCHFIVDGFDECLARRPNSKNHSVIDDRSKFLRHLMGSLAGTNSHVLLVSRENWQIREEFNRYCENISGHNEPIDSRRAGVQRPMRARFLHYDVEKNDTKHDIQSFASSIVTTKLHNKPSLLRDSIATGILEKCNGMFLWARLLDNRLSPGQNAKQLKKIISETPMGLMQAYEQDLKTILELSVDDRNRTIAILQWMLHGKKVFTVRELTEAVLVDTEHISGSFPEDDLPDAWDEYYVKDFIQKPCGSLVELRGEAINGSYDEMKVHFVHFSAQEFLLTTDINFRNPHFTRSMNLVYANESIARKCIIYLCYEQFHRSRHSTLYEIEDTCKDYAFWRYACFEGLNHLEPEGEYSQRLLSTLNHFLDPACTQWILSSDYVRHILQGPHRKPNLVTSPLHIAAQYGLVETVKYIIHNKFPLDLDCGEIGRPLDVAVSLSRLETVKVLLSYGASCGPNTRGLTPAHYLALNNKTANTSEVLQALVEAGANIDDKNNKGQVTPLSIAIKAGNNDIVTLLLKAGADIEARAWGLGVTPLYTAVISGQLEIMQNLLRSGANPNTSDDQGHTPLMFVIQQTQMPCFYTLIESGADLNATDHNGATALILAAMEGCTEVVEALLRSGANSNAVDNKGATALMLAAKGNYQESLYALAISGADLDAVDSAGQTALKWAVSQGHTDLIRILHDLGADIDTVDREGRTALTMAALNGHSDSVKALLRSGADPNIIPRSTWTALGAAASRGHADAVKALLESGADPNIARKNGMTALIAAAFNGHTDLVKPLLELGADPNATELYGMTALMIAAFRGYTDFTRALLDLGADPNAANRLGTTALMIVAATGHVQSMRALLDSGADVSARDQIGETALDYAVGKGHDAVAQELRAWASSPVGTASSSFSATSESISHEQVHQVGVSHELA